MLRDHPPDPRDAAPAACFVVPLCGSLTDRLRHHYSRVVAALACRGWRVHALVCPPDGGSADGGQLAAALRDAGANAMSLTETACPPEVLLGGPNLTPRLRAGDRVRHALAALHRGHGFNLIEFADVGGLGFRAVQARRTGLDFGNVPLLVTAFGPAAWQRRQQGRWPAGPAEVLEDYAERYAFENADRRLLADAALREELGSLGWALGDEAAVAQDEWDGEAINAIYRPMLGSAQRQDASSKQRPLVTVAIPHFNLGDCLPETLASVAAQTYQPLDVVVIDDGSTDPASRRVFREMEGRYPHYRFLTQPNAGIGATRNRALALARGEYFLPIDADNLARPDMVQRLVTALGSRPDLATVSSYFLAFEQSEQIGVGKFAYSYRPTGGPHFLAAGVNVYGDGNALFRTDALRSVGGFGTERDSSWEDWEAFVRLAHAGHRIEVVPDFLFYYRHRPAGFSRTTDGYRNQWRVLRHFVGGGRVPPGEGPALWESLAGLLRRVEFLEDENRTLRRRLNSRRYRLADRARGLLVGLRSLLP